MFYGSLSEPGFSSQKTLNFPTFSHILSPASSKSPHPRHHSLFIPIDQIWIEYMHVSLNLGQRSGKQAEGDSSPAGMPPCKEHLQKHLRKHLSKTPWTQDDVFFLFGITRIGNKTAYVIYRCTCLSIVLRYGSTQDNKGEICLAYTWDLMRS